MARQLLQDVDAAVADPALRALASTQADRPVLLLHSGRWDARWARRSIFAEPRAWFRYTAAGRSELVDAATFEPLPASRNLSHRLWRDLRTLLHDPAFPGKWIGCLSYDLGRLIEPAKLPPLSPDRPPLVELAWCPDATELPAPRSRGTGVPSGTGVPPVIPAAAPPAANLRSNLTRPTYEAAVRRALAYIAAGDIFQANLAQRFTCDYTGGPRDLYARLAAVSPAWYGAHIELPPERPGIAMPGPNAPRRALLSISPELFLHVHGREVTTRPIKGTLPASRPPEELLASEKDASELTMIVDLMRNDLGRVCDYGSVRVPEPRTVESHPTVHHTAATVTGRLHHSKDIIDLLRATLPGGSVTGAPKVRAMQIIDELEPEPRGPSFGCIGYLSKDEAQLNLAIRTLLLTPAPAASATRRATHRAAFAVGGGIVADSDPAAEYDETLAKARAMIQALRLDPGDLC